jgi:uncharacterized membrane protein YqjE
VIEQEIGERRGIPDAAGDLLRAVLGLFRSTARMTRFEAHEVAARATKRMVLFVASALVATGGCAIALGGLALFVEEVTRLPRWAGLLVVGVPALVLGLVGVWYALRRLFCSDLAFPRTLEEVRKDLEALETTEERP